MAVRAPVSILVLTLNEQVNIAACLETLAFSDDVVVLDSYSSDRTVEIASQYPNVRVVQRKFDTWCDHSNWALRNIDFKHPWVYYTDADERVPPELAKEIRDVVSRPGAHAAYRLRYRNMFRGRWLKRGGIYPVWIMRLFQPDRVYYEQRQVNAHPIVDGSVGRLQSHFIHHSFNKGLAAWFTKHNAYAEAEAREAMRVRQSSVWQNLRDLVSRDSATRRRGLKNLSFRIPCRAAARLFYMLIIKRGLLDGAAGFHYAMMISTYEYWIALKVRELQRNWSLATHGLAKAIAATQRVARSTNVDVMILTRNEASHIRDAVDSAKQLGGRVFVLDSGSDDGTQTIARDAGAHVVEHAFEGYAAQKNWGLDHLPFESDWVFILDADERITPALAGEVADVTQRGDVDGCYVNRLMLFMGRAVKHGGLYPSWNLRLLRRGKARYEQRSVHEHMLCDGPTVYLRQPMLHVRSESMTQYIAKHIRYADLESDEWLRNGGGAKPHALFSSMLGHRQWLRRNVWPRLPWRPLWRFGYMYILRGGIRDGYAGWSLAWLMANYEYMIALLMDEKRAVILEPHTMQTALPTRAAEGRPNRPAPRPYRVQPRQRQ